MFNIEINEIKEVECGPAVQYQKIADKGNKNDGGAIYDYVQIPGSVKKEKVTRMILMQSVDHLDMNAITKAINSIYEPPKQA